MKIEIVLKAEVLGYDTPQEAERDIIAHFASRGIMGAEVKVVASQCRKAPVPRCDDDDEDPEQEVRAYRQRTGIGPADA